MIALESFIDYCDNYQIANESVRSINKKYNKFVMNLEAMEKQIKSEKSVSKAIVGYQKMKTEIMKLRSELAKESEIGIADTGSLIKRSLMPIIVGAMTAGGAKVACKDGKKNDAASIIAAGGAFTTFAAIMAVDDIKEFKATKSNVLKVVDNYIKACDGMIEILRTASTHGAKTLDDVKAMLRKDVSVSSSTSNGDLVGNKYSMLYNIRQNAVKHTKAPEIGKPYPAPDESKSKDSLTDFMANDVIKYLKKYANSPSFKSQYKQFLHMINIKREDYSDVFTIAITDYQNGVDWDLVEKWKKQNPGKNHLDSPVIRTDWYDELLTAGEVYIKDKFKNWHYIIWNRTGTGDGDEGCIYVD